MSFLIELENTLKNISEYLDKDGKIIRGLVQEDAMNLNPRLLNIIIQNPKLEKMFFTKVGDIYAFDKVKFSWVLSNRTFLPDSYTRYKNKVGLIDSSENFLISNNDVLLSFPNKDCVLEFDSTDENEERPEVFFNELLSSDTIDVLFDEKVFTNFVYYKDGKEIKNNIDDLDNLVIKEIIRLI